VIRSPGSASPTRMARRPPGPGHVRFTEEHRLVHFVDGDWERQLLVVAHELLGIYVAHTWLQEAAPRSGPAGPNALRYFDRCLAIMAALPASPATKMEALGMLTGVVSLLHVPRPAHPDPRILFGALDPQAHPHLTAPTSRSASQTSSSEHSPACSTACWRHSAWLPKRQTPGARAPREYAKDPIRGRSAWWSTPVTSVQGLLVDWRR
jgi:hypothetical protein